MKLIVFGATGTVGRHIVDQALAQGHHVTAFTRDGAKVTTAHERLAVAQGEVTDAATVAKAVAGHDAVIVTLGAGRKGGVRAPGTDTVMAAMRETGVRRLIVQTTLGAGDSRSNLNFFWKRIMFGLILRPAYADHEVQEEHVRASELDWTIVRPGAFTDGPRTGEYRRGIPPGAKSTMKISRADVADFVLETLHGDEYLHQTPAIAY